MSRALIRAPRFVGPNGNGLSSVPRPKTFESIPPALREKITEAFEEEGIMQQPAENRILTALDGNHKETLARFTGLEKDLYGHDKRLSFVEKGQEDTLSAIDRLEKTVEPHEGRLNLLENGMKILNKAAETAADDRRDTKKMVKGAVIVAVVGMGLTAIFGYYGLKGSSNTAAAVAATAAPVQEAKKQDEALADKVDKLTEAITQDREARKKEPATPVRSRRNQGRSPEPIPGLNGPGASLREMRAIEPWSNFASLRYLSIPEQRGN